MPFVPYAGRKSRAWRDFLTGDEAEKLAEIEVEIEAIDKAADRRRRLAAERLRIVNRAAQRAGKATAA